MPTLNWLGKDAVVNHHQKVPFHLLKDVPELSVGDAGSGNLIIQGDNLLALKALLPYYAGQVKCIYIDPPYNTGNEGWIYNDNTNSSIIKEWLGKAVGKEAEDLSRHDKWLCMMYPRLRLLKEFLKDDGVIFISIDDNEYHRLVQLCDEIFGDNNKISTLIWDLGSGTQAGHFTRAHEYILCYGKNKNLVKNFSGGKGTIDDRAIKKISVKNPASNFTFPKGTKWEAEDGSQYTGIWGGNEKTELISGEMKCLDGKLISDVTLRAGWTQKSQMDSFFSGEKVIDSKGQKIIEFYFRKNGKIYCRKDRSIINPPTVIRELASTKIGTSELKDIFEKENFTFPKSSLLISFLLSLVTKDEDLVLDSFAGSGTTGHAVLKQNSIDSSNRRFILIEMDPKIAKEITSERLKRVSKGYVTSKGKKVKGLDGNFRFCELGEPVFNERGKIRDSVKFDELARHVFFTETGEPLTARTLGKSPLIGVHNGLGVYLLYNGILKDKSVGGGNVLTASLLSELPQHDGSKVIYGTACRIGADRLRTEGIVFKQLPYKLRISV